MLRSSATRRPGVFVQSTYWWLFSMPKTGAKIPFWSASASFLPTEVPYLEMLFVDPTASVKSQTHPWTHLLGSSLFWVTLAEMLVLCKQCLWSFRRYLSANGFRSTRHCEWMRTAGTSAGRSILTLASAFLWICLWFFVITFLMNAASLQLNSNFSFITLMCFAQQPVLLYCEICLALLNWVRLASQKVIISKLQDFIGLDRSGYWGLLARYTWWKSMVA